MPTAYQLPSVSAPRKLGPKQVQLVANGDLRLSANQKCWPAQAEMEAALTRAVAEAGFALGRAHPYDAEQQHGFIASQKQGMAVFAAGVDPDAPLIVAESVWQYSHHLLAGLIAHRGPILTVANWSGTWPGLVGMLNLNGSLTKAGVRYSTLWSDDFTDEPFRAGLRAWLATGSVTHPTPHARPLSAVRVGPAERELAAALATRTAVAEGHHGRLRRGVHGHVQRHHPRRAAGPHGRVQGAAQPVGPVLRNDGRCPTPTPTGRARTGTWPDGMKFHFGTDEATELTEGQVLLQCKTYVAAVRIADDFGCATIGIQYQQGLKDLLPASDLVEGTLNNADRPPVRSRDGSAGCCTTADRCRTSTRSTSAPALTGC